MEIVYLKEIKKVQGWFFSKEKLYLYVNDY